MRRDVVTRGGGRVGLARNSGYVTMGGRSMGVRGIVCVGVGEEVDSVVD